MSHIFFTPIPVSASWLVKFTTWSLALVRLTLMLVLRICSTKHWSWHPFPDSIVSQWKQLCLALPRCHEVAQALAWNTSQHHALSFRRFLPWSASSGWSFPTPATFESDCGIPVESLCVYLLQLPREGKCEAIAPLIERASWHGGGTESNWKNTMNTHMSLTSKFEVYLSQTCHWYQTGSFLTSMKLWICTHETLNLHWHRYFFQTNYNTVCQPEERSRL